MAKIQWNIYIAEVGFTENNIAKLRPVIAISEPVGDHNIVLVAPIYSAKLRHKLTGDINISDDYSDLGLVRPSTIRLHRIVSLSTADLKEQLGQASSRVQKAVKSELQKLLRI